MKQFFKKFGHVLIDIFTFGDWSIKNAEIDEWAVKERLKIQREKERLERQRDAGLQHKPYSSRCQDGGGEIRRCVMCETKWPCAYTEAKRTLDRINKQLKPKKETTMRVIDISPAMISKTVRIEKQGIIGTHNYIEGLLEDFTIHSESLGNMFSDTPTRVDVTGVTVRIVGHEFKLTGKEPLHIVSQG